METRTKITIVLLLVAFVATACGSNTPQQTLIPPTARPEPTLSPTLQAKYACRLTLHDHDFVVPFTEGGNAPGFYDLPAQTVQYIGDDNVLWTTSIICHESYGPHTTDSQYAVVNDMPRFLPSDAPSKSVDCLGTTFTITPGAFVAGDPVCQQPEGSRPQFIVTLADGTQLTATYLKTDLLNTPGPNVPTEMLTYSVAVSPQMGGLTTPHCGYHTSMTALEPYFYVNMNDQLHGTNLGFGQPDQSICAGHGFTVEMTTK